MAKKTPLYFIFMVNVFGNINDLLMADFFCSTDAGFVIRGSLLQRWQD